MWWIGLLAVMPVTDNPTPAGRIVAFAEAHIGRRVGDGECSTLAREALRHTGARSGRLWGAPLPSPKDARPGDILQFENAVFVHRELRPDGAEITLVYSYPHHTAIVAGVRKRGRSVALSLHHQNAGVAGADDTERKVVQRGRVLLAELRSGTLTAYRPIAEP